MAASEGVIAFAGVYSDKQDALDDFEAIKMAHKESWIGMYGSAVFEKDAEGKVKILNTDATTRGSGAKWGAVAGAVVGVIFPPSILVGAATGAAAGAVVGNIVKGFGRGDIKDLAEKLEPGQAGVVLVAEATLEEGAEKLMKRAKKIAKQQVDMEAEDLKKQIDAM